MSNLSFWRAWGCRGREPPPWAPPEAIFLRFECRLSSFSRSFQPQLTAEHRSSGDVGPGTPHAAASTWRSPDTTQTRGGRGAVKHLVGDRSEERHPPQLHSERARQPRRRRSRMLSSPAPQAPTWRAQRAIFFRRRLHKGFSCDFGGNQGSQLSSCKARARGRAASKPCPAG